MTKHILVTGGAGYIGSHTAVELLAAGYRVSIADNYINSSPKIFERLKIITGEDIPHYEIDLCDNTKVDELFAANDFDGVIHFAGLKAVDTSVAEPIRYYKNNLISTLNICEALVKYKVGTIIFSSSAAVYGQPETIPIIEDTPLHPANPYGGGKAMCEQILRDMAAAFPTIRVALLRYFNPVGAHHSGLIGEDPHGKPDNLTPYILRVAVGKLPELNIFGDDYQTPDGTGVRDYLHVVDLAKGHIAALEHPAEAGQAPVYNLGTGRGYSVFEMLHAFEKACGHTIAHRIAPRRPGDSGTSYADASRAERELNWKAEKTLEEMAEDGWRWQSMNPDGYDSPIPQQAPTT